MKAIVFKEPNKVAVEDVPMPKLEGPKDAIVRVTLTSICGTDIHMIRGIAPMMPGNILGHEFVGVVEKLGDQVEGFKVGDRVAVSCTVQCGSCEMCARGLMAKCTRGGIFGCGPAVGNFAGAQAEFVRVPFAQMAMHKVPDSLTDKQVLLVGDILCTGYFAVVNGNVTPGDAVAVFGAGPVGLATVACARLFSPSKLIVVGHRANRLAMAKKLGATHTFDPTKVDAVTEIKELTGGAPKDLLESFTNCSGADVVLEAVGLKSTFDACFQAVRPGGSVSIVGVFEEPQELAMRELCIRNIKVAMGLVNVVYIPRLIKLVEAGLLDATPLITHVMPLTEGVKAYEMFDKRLDNVLKIALEP